ncbi:hypothetical protein GEV33_003541 [Tenebrio molitor]|uniref:Uncharacterized protein n=1 Tax=Tenebrio molitor TaxID=7067 RepID=A0A8J6HI91_TENMO|nr:hypothetical protein GEV33_003541 [Tenebrio molitor]
MGGAATPQGRKLNNINNMPDRRYLPSLNFSVPFARTACVRWSGETPGCEGEHEDFDSIARNVASQDLVLQSLALQRHPNVQDVSMDSPRVDDELVMVMFDPRRKFCLDIETEGSIPAEEDKINSNSERWIPGDQVAHESPTEVTSFSNHPRKGWLSAKMEGLVRNCSNWNFAREEEIRQDDGKIEVIRVNDTPDGLRWASAHHVYGRRAISGEIDTGLISSGDFGDNLQIELKADGLRSPLSPTHKLRTATPVAHGAVGLGSLPERFMGKQIVVCHLPVPRLEAKTAVSPVLFLPEGKKDLTPRIGPREGDPCSAFRASVPRRGPSRHPLINHFKNQSQHVRQLRGAICSPNLGGPKTGSPPTFRGRLILVRRPHSRSLPQAII